MRRRDDGKTRGPDDRKTEAGSVVVPSSSSPVIDGVERMTLREFQQRIDAIYGVRDRRRGTDATFRWLAEEVGELARALRTRQPGSLSEEISDVLAWTVSVATLAGVDVEMAAARYSSGCPKCGQVPCKCPQEPPA